MIKSIFKVLFPYHLEQVEIHHGKDAVEKYIIWVDRRISSLLLMFFLSLLSLFSVLVGDGISRGIYKLILLNILAVVISVSQLKEIRTVKSELFDDVDIAFKWIKVMIVVSLFSIFANICPVVQLISYIDLSVFKEETIEIEEVGYKMTLPKRWTDVEWQTPSKPQKRFQNYYFDTSDIGDRMLRIELYSWAYRPGTEVSQCSQIFTGVAEQYLDGGFKTEPILLNIGGKHVIKSVGLRKDNPDYIFVMHHTVHQGTLLCQIFAFPKTADMDEQVAYADQIFSLIEFSQKELPDYVQRAMDIKYYASRIPDGYKQRSPVKENKVADKLPEDFILTEDALKINSANMHVPLPGGKSKLEWKQKNRSFYDFSIGMGGYDLSCFVTVVWTSENASIFEAEDIVTYYAKREFTSRVIHAPEVVVIGNKQFWKTIGINSAARDKVNAYYLTYHKGSRLIITASIPSDCDYTLELRNIESFIGSIEFK